MGNASRSCTRRSTTGYCGHWPLRNDPLAPLPLRQALRVIDRHVAVYITETRMIA